MDIDDMKRKWTEGALSLQEAEMFINLLIIENTRLKKLMSQQD